MNQALYRRFTLTLVFVAGSALLLVGAGFAADLIGKNVAESSTIRIETELAEADAARIAQDIEELLAGLDRQLGFAYLEMTSQVPDARTRLQLLVDANILDSQFDSIDFYHLELYGSSGESFWEMGPDQGIVFNQMGFETAMTGESASWLDRGVTVHGPGGVGSRRDLLESMIPLYFKDEVGVELVLHHAVDVTDTLESNVLATRADVWNSVMILLGALLGVLALFVLVLDLKISKRIEVATELRDREELERANIELQRMDEMKTNFLSSLSHELKTPLAAILGFARILRSNKRQNLEVSQIEQLEVITRNGTRLDVLINDLHDLSRIQSGRVKLLIEEVELKTLVESVALSFATVLQGSQQSMVLKTDHDPVWLKIDQTRVSQVLSNLISNASKYSPNGSTITVSSKRDGDSASITVEDQGQGIHLRDQENLFKLFYRTPEALNSSTHGTGIGLYVTKQIVELHDGEIDLVSVPLKGTKVTVTLFGAMSVPSDPKRSGQRFTNVLDDLAEAS